MILKPIETIYNGHRFRSRLEARWAVFFDSLGIRWLYEHEGFDLDGIWYLPDFLLPELKCWIEVKGSGTDGEFEWEKCRRLNVASGMDVFMFFDDFCPLHPFYTTAPSSDDPGDFDIRGSNRGWIDGVFEDGCVEWSECLVTGMIYPGLHGVHEKCSFSPGNDQVEHYDSWSGRLINAYCQAKMSRF